MLRSLLYEFAGWRILLVLLVFPGTVFAQSAAAGSEQEAATRPLRPLMVDLSLDMERIHQGLWREDYVMIAQGARSIAEHPKITSEQMAAIKKALGTSFKQFVQFDVTVHEAASALADAAADENLKAVLKHRRQLQQGCISCHAGFREQVREAFYGDPRD